MVKKTPESEVIETAINQALWEISCDTDYFVSGNMITQLGKLINDMASLPVSAMSTTEILLAYCCSISCKTVAIKALSSTIRAFKTLINNFVGGKDKPILYLPCCIICISMYKKMH